MLEVQGEGHSAKATLASQSKAPVDHIFDGDNNNTLFKNANLALAGMT